MNDVSIFIFVFVFGASIGSFLNVLVARHNTGMTLSGRSQCMFCGHILSWYELVPVLSFVIQVGRCRMCKGKISWRYPAVELTTGLLFLLIYNLQPTTYDLVFYWLIASILIVIAAYDMRHKIIPDTFVYAFIFLGFLNLFGVWDLAFNMPSFLDLSAGPLLFLPFAGMWFFSHGTWMGFGDAKLAWGIGWFLGIGQGIAAIVLAFWIGAAASLLLLGIDRITGFYSSVKQFTMKSEVPFGPFLILGTFIVLLYGIGFSDLIYIFAW